MVENDFLASELQKLDSLLEKLNLLQWTVQINLALLMQKVFCNNGALVLKLKLSQNCYTYMLIKEGLRMANILRFCPPKMQIKSTNADLWWAISQQSIFLLNANENYFLRAYIFTMCLCWIMSGWILNFIGIRFMQGWTATKQHGVTRKRSTKRLKHTGNLFRKNLQLKGVC